LRGETGVIESADDDAGLTGAQLSALESALASGQGGLLRLAVVPALQPLRTQLRGLLHYHLGSPSLRTRDVMQGVRKLIDSGTLSR
jgi:DNA repair protein RecO (recombination protein O)